MRITLEWLPLIKRYQWPFNFLDMLTEPYFQLWRQLFPSVRIQQNYMDVSILIGLEVLNLSSYFLLRLINVVNDFLTN